MSKITLKLTASDWVMLGSILEEHCDYIREHELGFLLRDDGSVEYAAELLEYRSHPDYIKTHKELTRCLELIGHCDSHHDSK